MTAPAGQFPARGPVWHQSATAPLSWAASSRSTVMRRAPLCRCGFPWPKCARMAERIRLLVVDDHPVFRRGLLAVLSDAEDIEVVGAVGTGTDAIEAAAELAPDIMLLDLNLPDTNGIDVTKMLVASGFSGQVLVLTMYAEDAALVSAMEAGARGYLLKGASQEEIVSGIRSVVAGGMVFGAQVSAQVAA